VFALSFSHCVLGQKEKIERNYERKLTTHEWQGLTTITYLLIKQK
jgi:hypothetical protein